MKQEWTICDKLANKSTPFSQPSRSSKYQQQQITVNLIIKQTKATAAGGIKFLSLLGKASFWDFDQQRSIKSQGN